MAHTEQRKYIATAVTLAVITLLVVVAHLTAPHQSATQSQAVAKTTTPAQTSTKPTNAHYKDGTYMADGSYSSPGGPQSVSVKITLAGGKITDANVAGKAQNGVAQIYQSYFVKGYRQYVVGKKIDGLKLSRVAGSSLTSNGFNAAIKKIEKQAS